MLLFSRIVDGPLGIILRASVPMCFLMVCRGTPAMQEITRASSATQSPFRSGSDWGLTEMNMMLQSLLISSFSARHPSRPAFLMPCSDESLLPQETLRLPMCSPRAINSAARVRPRWPQPIMPTVSSVRKSRDRDRRAMSKASVFAARRSRYPLKVMGI